MIFFTKQPPKQQYRPINSPLNGQPEKIRYILNVVKATSFPENKKNAALGFWPDDVQQPVKVQNTVEIPLEKKEPIQVQKKVRFITPINIKEPVHSGNAIEGSIQEKPPAASDKKEKKITTKSLALPVLTTTATLSGRLLPLTKKGIAGIQTTAAIHSTQSAGQYDMLPFVLAAIAICTLILLIVCLFLKLGQEGEKAAKGIQRQRDLEVLKKSKQPTYSVLENDNNSALDSTFPLGSSFTFTTPTTSIHTVQKDVRVLTFPNDVHP